MVLILNDIGGGEIVLILIFILIFFGSKSIPGLARTFGRTIRQIKDASNDLQSEIRKSSSELKNDLNLTEIIDDTARDIRQPLDQYAADIEDVMKHKPTNSVPKQNKVIDTTPLESLESPTIPPAPKAPEAPKVEIKEAPAPKTGSSKDAG
ncbi:MAG: twin-arginine translocase TatA/TatE family subunit [Crocinitomicaceae bacterium]